MKKFLKIISRQNIIRADTPIKSATIGHMFFVAAESCWLHVFTSDLGCRCLPILFFQNRTDNQLHRLRPHCSQRSEQVSSQCEQKKSNYYPQYKLLDNNWILLLHIQKLHIFISYNIYLFKFEFNFFIV